MTVKTIKIINPANVLEIAPQIEDYVKKVNNKGVYPSTFKAYLMQTVLNGGDMAELWVAIEDGKPAGFVRCGVLGLPYISDISVDAIYSWSKNLGVATELYKTFVGFAKKHNAKRIHAYCYDERIFKHSKRLLREYFDFKMENTEAIHCVGEL